MKTYSEIKRLLDELQADDENNIERLKTILAIDGAGIELDNIDEVGPCIEEAYDVYTDFRYGQRSMEDFCNAVRDVMDEHGVDSPLELDEEQLDEEVNEALERRC